jgi:sulfite exporter TauE/SafE
MLEIIIAGFTMGIIGSFHCMGMCGPLALSLPISQTNSFNKFLGALVYNLGRVVTYATFGLLFGIIGKSVALFGFQQWLSIILGVLIIVFVLMPKLFPSVFKQVSFKLNFLEKVRIPLGKLFSEKKQSSLFTIGLLNGLLPCGLVYMAIAGATATGDVYKSIAFMSFFGLGTLPMMWSIAFLGNYIGISLRKAIRNLYPYVMTLMACLLILRGLGLGIPYVSPGGVDQEKKEIRKCCHK